jgi:two-component system sensor histidine kinase YesM
MKKKLKTVQSSLFYTYSLIIITVLIIFVLFFYFWVSTLLKTEAFETISNLATSTSEKLDIQIQKMDSVSMNILYSNIIKDRFDNYIHETDAENESNNDSSEINEQKANSIENSKELIDILFCIIGPNRPVQQIYLYDFNSKVFGTGVDNRQRNKSVSELSWYKDVMSMQGKKYLTVPMKDDELLKFVTQKKDIYFISLCRMYYDKYGMPQGIIEVKQYYDDIFKTLQENIKNNINKADIYVYNSNGVLIYPLVVDSRATTDCYYYKLKKSVSTLKSSISAVNPYTHEKELLDIRSSEYTGWTTIVAVSENKLLSPLLDFSRSVLIVTAIILLFALTLSFFAAKKITIPLSNLRKAIKNTNLNLLSNPSILKLTSDLNELEDLNQAFQNMNEKVKQSHDDLMLSQKQEMQSKMLALQSQMNPHFLYNTLANISVMAEEAMYEHIIEMCSNLSDMLRYISSDQSPHVNLSTEIEYTERYLGCMKSRYGNKLSYSIELEDDLKKIKVPKMIVQPLVENAIKYSTSQKPPWKIKIYGYKSNTFWQITVRDSGSGFDAEKLDNIRKKISEIDRNGLLPSLELDGMGLLNIYIRLKLSYKNQTIFQIADNIDGGANVTIGGSL